jgi:hypothetical protein
MSARDYRLRVRNAADDAWEHTFTAFYRVPQAGGQRVYVLAGKTSSKPWICEIVDDAEDLTGALAEELGTHWRYTLLRRKADISVSIDGGAYTVQATGRITNIELAENQAVYRVTLSDERSIERSSQIFTYSDTTSVWPMRRITEAGNVVVWVEKARSNPITLIRLDEGFSWDFPLPEQARTEINADVKPGLSRLSASQVGSEAGSGSFHNLRIGFTSAAYAAPAAADTYEVVGFRVKSDGLLWSASSVLVTDEPVPAGEMITGVYVLDPDYDLNTSTKQYCVLFFPARLEDGYYVSRPPNRNVPLHIEGNVWDILEDIYTGVYGGETVEFDATQMAAMQADTRYPPNVTYRIDSGPVNMAKWVETHIYKPFLVVPLINTEGKLYPQPITLPDADTVPDVSALTVLDGSNVTAPITWRLATDNQITRASFRYERHYQNAYTTPYPQEYTGALDRMTAVEVVESHDDDVRIAQYGVHEHEVLLPHLGTELAALDDPDANTEHTEVWGKEFLNRFSDGAPTYTAMVDDTVTETIGDYLIIDADETFTPNAGVRAEKRLVQLMSREPTADGAKLELLDTGPYLGALTVPAVDIFNNVNDGRHMLRITISNLGTSQFELQMARGDYLPTVVWWNVAAGDDSTLDIGGLVSGEHYYARARTIGPQRTRSDWCVPDGASTDPYSAPTGVTATATNNEIALSWTNTHEELGVEVWYDTNTPIAPGTTATPYGTFQAGTDACNIDDGLATETLYYCGVRHVGPYGGVSSFGTDSDTTGATEGTLLAPDEIYIQIGTDVGTRTAP